MTEKRTIRVPLLFTPDEAKKLDDWQFANRLRTRSDALREMMRLAISLKPGEGPKAVGNRSKPK